MLTNDMMSVSVSQIYPHSNKEWLESKEISLRIEVTRVYLTIMLK